MRQEGEAKEKLDKKMPLFFPPLFKIKGILPPLRHQKVKIIMKKLNEAKVLWRLACGFDLDTVNILVINTEVIILYQSTPTPALKQIGQTVLLLPHSP